MIIFTKYDLLVNEKVDEVPDTVEDDDELVRLAKELAEDHFRTYALQPIQELCDVHNIPPVLKVSG